MVEGLSSTGLPHLLLLLIQIKGALCRYNLDDFYAPIGPRTKIMGGQITRPLLANLIRGLISLLILFIVPLLYVVIFRARKKHAMALGESDNTLVGFLIINQEYLKERELGGQQATPSGRKFTLVLGS